jgi:membrane associated rhomboid family serine protease
MFQHLAPVTRLLIIANVLVYVLQNVIGSQMVLNFALWPLGPGLYSGAPTFQVWQLVSYAFLHDTSNLAHIFFNMFALYMFGSEIERLLGASRYAVYYLVCVIGAAVAQLLVMQWMGGDSYPTVGASGGVFGLLLAFGMAFPYRRLMLLFPPIPMPAWLFVTLYGVLELVLGVTGTQQGVAHFAHLGGMAAGFVLLQVWRRRRR